MGNLRTLVMLFLLCVCAAAATMAAPYDRFTVRSAPFADRDTAVKNSNAIAAYGYHPVIQIEKTEGTQYYFLEMGSFDNMNTALELVTLFKNMGYEFFIVGATGAEGTGDTGSSALIHPGKAARLFPYQGEPVVDQLSLLESIPYDNTPIPRPPWDSGTPAPDKDAFTRAQPRMLKAEPYAMPNVPELSYVERRLRDTAWELRSKGFDVVSETETYIEPMGVLVGIFDNMDAAEELQKELAGYGYNTSIDNDDTPDGTQFLVYAEIEQIKPPIISLDNNTGNTGTSAQSDPAGGLLKLQHPKKDRGISPKR